MKVIKSILIFFCFIIIICLFLFLYFGHPNDSRISIPVLSAIQHKTKHQKKIGSLFELSDKIKFSIDLEKYRMSLGSWKNSYNEIFQIDSKRFTNERLFFTSLGSYPERIEGHTTIMLPVGEDIEFTLPFSIETHIDFHASSIYAANKIKVSSEKKILTETKLHQIESRRKPNDFWYKKIFRYLKPDAEIPGGKWLKINATTLKDDHQKITISCLGKKGGCILSEPTFWQSSKNKKKNIIFILIDTMRYDAISQKTTPTLNKFKLENTNFTRAIAPGNMTSPSTNAILSCRIPSKIGNAAFSYSMSQEDKNQYYSENKPSLAHPFDKAGWKTAMIGNISVISETIGVSIDHGFKENIAIERETYDTPMITREALSWLNKNSNKDFFLYLHYHAPHAPYRAPFSDIIHTFPGLSGFSSFANALKWLYKAELRITDRYIDKLFKGLKELDLYDQSVIVLTSDHGDQHQNRSFDENEYGEAFSGAYFDHGATLFQDEVRVPLIIKDSYQNKKINIDDFVSSINLTPTILDMFDLQTPTWCDGESILPLIKGNKAQLKKKVIGIEGFKRRAVIWDERYKYIRQYHAVSKLIFPKNLLYGKKTNYFAPELLFDLKNDINEENNLIHTDPKLYQKSLEVFNKYYNLNEIYELTISNPKKEKITIEGLEHKTINQNKDFSWKKNIKLASAMSHIKDKYLFRQSRPFYPLPTITINDIAVPIKYTQAKLPLHIKQEDLPRELNNQTQILKNNVSANISKIIIENRKQNRIESENPQFRKILKEWGYLNEGN